jgi:2-furoyl-CoA dehydrogenase large subunit
MARDAGSAMGQENDTWIGRALPRKEDLALLTGNARFIDDLEPVAGLKHAAILRSPHAHARIVGIDTQRAAGLAGVAGVVTGNDVQQITRPIPSVVKVAIDYYPIAVEKVRFVGEPVAIVVADDRYIAEDALDLIDVEYEPLDAAVDVERAMAPDAPVLHEAVGSNVANSRSIDYGHPAAKLANSAHVVELRYRFPKYASTPIETYGVIAQHEAMPDRYAVWSNFQGPFVLHPLMAGALGVPGNRLRLISPPASGGSFGIKQGVYPYIVLMCAVSRLLGCPVKWIEDRLEHLAASSSATDRLGSVTAGFDEDGELRALRFSNVCNMGAYIRAPEPASVYRMQSTTNGCYKLRDIGVDNSLVVTNQMPTGLNRGFGGPQFFFALERVMDVAARKIGIDPLELRKRNFIAKDQFPYAAPGGSLMDAGDYQAAVAELERLADYPALLARRAQARVDGRLFGIGIACGVEPSGSNMGYVSLAQTPEERGRSEPKSGANTSAVISMDPTGAVTVHICTTPNGQGHATVAAQIVADRLGLEPDRIDVVTEIDTRVSSWSIASGNYANRFAAAVTSALAVCGDKVAAKLSAMAAEMFDCAPDDVVLSGGEARVPGTNKTVPVRRLAAAAHWNPADMPEHTEPGIYETVVISPDVLTSPDAQDRVPSSVTYGSVFDLAAVEVDPATGKTTIEKYVSVHDVGTVLNPHIVEGQVWGGFVHGLGGAMLEEIAYDANGNLLSGTFADYLCPTAPEVPDLVIGHANTISPHTVLGAKGLGDGSSMLAPAALANAVSDALQVDEVDLPLTSHRVWLLVQGRKPAPTTVRAPHAVAGDSSFDAVPEGLLKGNGAVMIDAPARDVWAALTDPEGLHDLLPGCRSVQPLGGDRYLVDIELGVAGLKGRYQASFSFLDLDEATSLRIAGEVRGALGYGRGEGRVILEQVPPDSTQLQYVYGADVGGKVAAVGQRMLARVTEVMIAEFFEGLNARLTGTGAPRSGGLLTALRRLLRFVGRGGGR